MIAIDANGLMHQTGCEMGGEGVRQAAFTRQLGTEQARTEQPHRHLGAGPGHGNHALIRRTRAQVAHQLGHILWEIIGAAGTFASQRTRGHLIRTRRTAEPQINAPGVEAFKGAELLGNHQRRMVRQHHTARAHANGRCTARQITDQHRGRGTGDAVHVVVFGNPKAVIAKLFHVLRQIQRIVQRLGSAAAFTHGHQIEG